MQTTLELTYRKSGKPVRELRVVTPRTLCTSQRGNDYLVAYDHDRREVRSFRVDRIENIRPAGNAS